MDEMTAFDQQIAREVLREAGPSEPVDGAAILNDITTASQSPRWGFPMFSALKLIAAGIIVALFGGFLLAGVLTTQQDDEVPPAAVTESPSPMTAEELLSGMVTEEVEPGVLRVINDGVRDLTYPAGWGGAGFRVDVTPDGSVWLSVDEDEQGLFRLGEEPVFENHGTRPHYREVAPDGSLWGLGDHRRGIFSFDGEGWTARATTTDGGFSALTIGPDGTVWVIDIDEDKPCPPDIEDRDCQGSALLRLEDDGSLTTIEGWSDVYDGDATWRQLAVSPDGEVWLVGTRVWQRADLLLRFDGEGWAAIPGPEGWDPGEIGRYLGVAPDGTLWVQADATSLARFDDPGWTTFTNADGRIESGSSDTVMLEVAADGSVWLLSSPTDVDDWGGVTHFDGTTWTSYLAGSYIEDFAIAPDGSVWLGAADGGSPFHLYVITPEAVSATA